MNRPLNLAPLLRGSPDTDLLRNQFALDASINHLYKEYHQGISRGAPRRDGNPNPGADRNPAKEGNDYDTR